MLWRIRAMLLVLVGRRPGWGEIPRGVALGGDVADAPTLPLPR
jgi:hypothetical protein